ncbi:hypothetical protein JM658_16860 [Joostella atrarenae]|uniref:Uncharacterized protein n=1 Tax=Joostella atrarenae TaxID=679257 RepID=A0ABS9J7W1_9FLAO|nr:hypothetical protein [Joostella atrarenae]MCF8716495.1 hypothetical protein [Joostella atrarenae]
MKSNVESIKGKISEINEVIDNNFLQEKSIGVLSGIGGVVLFKYFYNLYKPDYKNIDVIERILQISTERINNGYKIPTYCAPNSILLIKE